MSVYVCMYVCVCPLISSTSHIGITKERYQRIHRNTGIVLNFSDFPKNASFKSYGVIYAYLEQLQHPRAFFPTKYVSFYSNVKPIAKFSLHRQRACGRQRAIH